MRGLENTWTYKETEHAVVEQWLRSYGGGTHENKRRFLLLVSLSSPRSLVKPDPSNDKGARSHLGVDKGIYTLFETVAVPDPFLKLKT